MLGNVWENALVIGVYGKMSQDNLNQLMKAAPKDKFKGAANGSSNGKSDTRNTKGDQFQSNNGVDIKISSSLEGLPPKAREAIAMRDKKIKELEDQLKKYSIPPEAVPSSCCTVI